MEDVTAVPARERAAGFILLLILGCAAALRLWHLTSASFWLDEFFTDEVASGRGYWMWDLPRGHLLTANALNIAGHGWSGVIDALLRSNHPPAYFLVLHGWIGVFGEGDRALRMFSVCASVAAIGLFFDTMRSLQGTRAALCGAAAMALAGPQIQLAQEARAYPMLLTLILAATAAVARIDRRGVNTRRLIALGVATFGTVLTHYLGLPAIAALLLFVMLRFSSAQRRQAAMTIVGALILAAALWGPFAWVQHDRSIWRLPWASDGVDPIRLKIWVQRLAELPVQTLFVPLRRSSAVAVCGAVIYVLPLGLLRRRPDLLLWWLLLIGTVGTLVCGDIFYQTQSIGVLRYLSPATVAVYALIIGTISTIRCGARLAMCVPVISCAITCNRAFAVDTPDARELSRYVIEHCRSGDAIAFINDESVAWGDRALYMRIRHYAENWSWPIIFLDSSRPASIRTEVPDNRVLVLNQSPIATTKLIPQRRVDQQLWFPTLAFTCEVEPRQTQISSATN